jgi:hypothetical protein
MKQCCETETIYSGYGFRFGGKVSVPVPDPGPDPDPDTDLKSTFLQQKIFFDKIFPR